MNGASESAKPPVARPPAAPPGPGRDGMEPYVPASAGAACQQASGMTADAFWGSVRATISREWIRLSRGTEAVDVGLELSDRYTHMLEDLVGAMKTGHVVPGLKATASNKCEMDWFLFACFVRYYGKQVGWRRDYIRDQLRVGTTLEELNEDELLGEHWTFCKDPASLEEQDREWCCPEEIRKDWYYGDLAAGRAPGSKTNWLPIIALGLGGAAMVAAFVLSQTSAPATVKNPSSTGGRDKDRDARKLRLRTASEHPFETWDETLEYLQGRSAYPTADVVAANYQAKALVDELSARGVRTDLHQELQRLLDISSGVYA